MKYQEAIGAILKEMMTTAEKQEVQSPDWWIDKAQMLAALWTTVTDDLVTYEMKYKKEIVDRLDAGDSVAAATLRVEAVSENFRTYRYLKKKDEQVSEVIKIAKKRIDLIKL